jgi:hypothetical protein
MKHFPLSKYNILTIYRSPMYRNGKLMAKVNTSMQMKLQELGMEKYKAILKG